VRDQLIKLDCNVQLKEGAGGAFDVVVNNTLRFSKKPAGSFPSTKEIIGIIQGIAN
jgi:predicted Rdx family selenoprotein